MSNDRNLWIVYHPDSWMVNMFDMVRFHVWWRNHHFQELSPHVLGRHRSTPRCVQVVSQSWPKVEGKVLEIAESLYKNLLPGGYFQMALLSKHGGILPFLSWGFSEEVRLTVLNQRYQRIFGIEDEVCWNLDLLVNLLDFFRLRALGIPKFLVNIWLENAVMDGRNPAPTWYL